MNATSVVTRAESACICLLLLGETALRTQGQKHSRKGAKSQSKQTALS